MGVVQSVALHLVSLPVNARRTHESPNLVLLIYLRNATYAADPKYRNITALSCVL
ncbi:uncharacterized protein ASCRUDRAFT_75143 [Ascoidea rubescens DSM 1968]|uniref:Uncharacterized protein n=1 Tax=Ascoidea rubescens DSM 1968 TaxID=1344418 RepID=A0A1D2VJW6_9ASCO|nr:hypothetical protein ASCRUDRAFT_75143 [Ascoidea rubescens DSM 1968]ODV61880.1 hypothetical protein ASCRUDRAFT_75143 [Ascoidea rubescens DSM 1968]